MRLPCMKLLNKLLFAIFGLIILLFIAALFVPNDFRYEKSITINKPIAQVWQHTSSLAALEQWNPWRAYDKNLKKQIYGKDGVKGAKSVWSSNVAKVGVGKQTIVKVEKPFLFATELEFTKPYKAKMNSYIKLQDKGDNTIVTWGFSNTIPYPFNLINATVDMEKEVSKDFVNGLQKLKSICEK